MYSDIFCRVYNEFGWNYYPEIFGQQLLQWLKQENYCPKTALDLACGTGVLCRILKEAGIDAAGMDVSSGMIHIAREADAAISYDVADMITYRPQKQFDLVTCTGDALNHIGALSDVEQIFQNVFAYLAPGGYFVFDLLKESEVSDSEPFEMPWQEKGRVWFQMTRPGENKVNLKIRYFEEEKQVFEENIRETIHDPNTICTLLERSGLQVDHCGDSLLRDGGHGTTWFIIAKKGEVR